LRDIFCCFSHQAKEKLALCGWELPPLFDDTHKALIAAIFVLAFRYHKAKPDKSQ
jgi:hypothetical protein